MDIEEEMGSHKGSPWSAASVVEKVGEEDVHFYHRRVDLDDEAVGTHTNTHTHTHTHTQTHKSTHTHTHTCTNTHTHTHRL
jgi:hypothetical protein